VDIEGRTARFAPGGEMKYDALLLALGARPETAVPGAFTFRGPADSESFRHLLDQVKLAGSGRLVFAVPSGPVWPLPLYELALLTAAEFARESVGVVVSIVSSEPSPLALFGGSASDAVRSLLDERRIGLVMSTYPAEFANGTLLCGHEKGVAADWVVSSPRLTGSDVAGIPLERNGFVPVDEFSRVQGADRVYAAGDMTTFPIKQGGIAAAQADAAAMSIAALAGADVDPRPFRPILRALLVSGEPPMFLRIELGGGHGETSTVSEEALWWPPGKIVGRYLSPFLAGLGVPEVRDVDDDAMRVEIDSERVHDVGVPRPDP
jgi:sulfide:quinone oxidoreductase